jgi:hypothetical protein
MTIAAGLAAAVAWGWRVLVDSVWATGDGKLQALALLGTTGLLDLAVLVLLARLMRIEEVNEVVRLVTGRLRRRR